MIEELARLIPNELKPLSGKAFYSGRDAFQVGRAVYLLGYNPGGDPGAHDGETIAVHTDQVLTTFPANWSAYRDEPWIDRGVRRSPGTATFQPAILKLLADLNHDPGCVPSSNLVFVRSPKATNLISRSYLERLCWTFHAEAIKRIGPRFVICFGMDTGRLVCAHLRAEKLLDRFEEPNDRRWRSDARISDDGRVVFTLTHPSQAKWTTSATDPRPMVVRVFQGRA